MYKVIIAKLKFEDLGQSNGCTEVEFWTLTGHKYFQNPFLKF